VKPAAVISEPVAPINGASISEFCTRNDLFMGRTPEQCLPVFIAIAQSVMGGVDHRS
jgi:hypothetical protein